MNGERRFMVLKDVLRFAGAPAALFLPTQFGCARACAFIVNHIAQ